MMMAMTMTAMMAVMTLPHENYKEREMKSKFQANERGELKEAIRMNDVDVTLVWMNLLRRGFETGSENVA